MRTTRGRILLVALLVVLLPASAFGQDIAAKVDEYIAAQMKANQFSGSVLIAKDGKVLVSKGYGLANREWDVPNTPQTKFRLGSITKQFTSMSIMLLEERGKLKTDDPICKYLEPCPDTWKPVTIFHLLTHTSGIPSYTGLPDFQKTTMQRVTHEEMVARFRDLPLDFPVGTQFKYDNSGYYLLGMIIEKVGGQSYADFLQANIFGPLGMKDSGYDVSEKILQHRASGYSRGPQGVTNAAYLDMSQPYAAGSLYSTIEDLFIWDRALAAGKLISAASYQKMWTPNKSNYAFGWVVVTDKDKVISHNGGINGFSTHFSRYPNDQACVIVFSNLENGNASRVAGDLSKLLAGGTAEIPREHVVARVDPKIYDEYAGRYQLAPTFSITVTREGDKLMTQATGQGKVEVFPESETKFFLRVVDAQITFVKDAAGKVTELILHQNGRDQHAKKVE